MSTHREMNVDVLIVGGTTGGVAAALGAARHGVTVAMVESTDWIGGQLTAQGVPPDENQWIETFGGTRAYQAFRTGVRAWYRANRPLTDAAKADERLNPGKGWVSRLCFEPAIGSRVLTDMLAPHRALVHVVLEHRPILASVDGDCVRGVTFRGPKGDELTVSAAYVLDATDLGDALPLCGASFRIGAEHVDDHAEMHARADHADPRDQQALSWCFAVEHRPDEPRPIDRPDCYDFWRTHVPDTNPPWPGPLFSWVIPTHNKEGVRTLRMIPSPDEPVDGELELWRYRRIRSRDLYRADAGGSFADVCLVNWVQMDHWLAPVIDDQGVTQPKIIGEARRQSECLLYWMQHDAPRHDGDGTGYPGIRLARGVLSQDGFARAPYIREPRRLEAVFMITERHIGTEQRRQEKRADQDATPTGQGERFDDSIGIGHYHIDLHPSATGRGSVYIPATPFRIPLGSIIPNRLMNLLASGKCLGVTHVANGATRMHPVEWNVGESAGVLAAWCVKHGVTPRGVLTDRKRLREYQSALTDDGVRLSWPWE